MFNITRKEINWGGRPLVLETGKIARQADGSLGDVAVAHRCCARPLRTKQYGPVRTFFPSDR